MPERNKTITTRYGVMLLTAAGRIATSVVTPSPMNVLTKSAADDKQRLMDEDTFHDGLTDFYHVWTLAEAFLLGSMPLPAAPLLRWLKMYCQSNEDEDARYELNEAEAAALKGDAMQHSMTVGREFWRILSDV